MNTSSLLWTPAPYHCQKGRRWCTIHDSAGILSLEMGDMKFPAILLSIMVEQWDEGQGITNEMGWTTPSLCWGVLAQISRATLTDDKGNLFRNLNLN